LLLIGAVALPLGCGSSSTPADPPPTPELVDLSGSVTGYDADDHVIRTSFGEGLVGADGSFTVSIPAGGGCQLAFLVAPDDTPALLGWLGGSRTTVDTRSTAEVLAYFALGGYLLPLDNQTMLIEALEQDAAVDDLGAAIETALTGDAASLVDHDSAGAQSIRDALVALSAHFAQLYGPAAEGDKIMSISPSGARSGIHVLADGSRINTVTVVNDYRRRGYAEIAQESWVQESDGQTVTTGTPVPGSPQWLEPTNGVGSGVLSVTEDIFNGIYDVGTFAYEPVEVGTFTFPMPSGASSATYTITTMGPGTEFGDLASLTLEQREQALYVNGYSLVADVIIPAMMNVIVPINNAGGTGEAWMRFLRTPDAMSILEDMANVLLAEPEVATDLAEGEYVQALSRSWETVVQGGAFQTLAMNFFSYGILALEQAGVLSSTQVGDALGTTYMMANVFRALEIVDIILGAGDLGVAVAHIGLSNMADVWTITVYPPVVRLTPEVSRIDPYETVTLGAAVPELTGSSSDVTFKYLWGCTGINGTIADAAGHSGTSFESSHDFVTYIAENGTAGGDRVSVRVTQVITGAGGTQEAEIGTDTAIVLVGGDGTWLEPSEAELQPGETVTLTLSVLVDEDLGDPADLTYLWTCDEAYGAVIAGGTASDSTLTYMAGFNAAEANEIITAEAFLPGGSGPESQGESEAIVTVAPPELRIIPVAPVVPPEESITLTAEVVPTPDGVLTYVWSCTEEYGFLSGSGVDVDYVAGTDEGHDVVEVEITHAPPGGGSVVLGVASVAVEVDTPVSGEACELELDTLNGIMFIDPTGYRTFSAEVRDCFGAPVEGETVTLTIEGPGHFDDTVVTTNASGRASTILHGDAMGAARITGETSNGIVDVVYWVFGGDVDVTPGEGVLITDHDIVELNMTVTSGDLMGARLDYGWTVSQSTVDNWDDFVGDLVVDENDLTHATLYAGWAPDPPDIIRVVGGAYAYWGEQRITLGYGHYEFTTVYNPSTVAAMVDVESCDNPGSGWYRAKVQAGFEWGAGVDEQYRYYLYHEDCSDGPYGMDWIEVGILCGQVWSSDYPEGHQCWEPDEEKAKYLMYLAFETFDNPADRDAWAEARRLEAQNEIAPYSLEIQAIPAVWPPTENACYGSSPPTFHWNCPPD
jgi:hypothetical protein